MLAESSATDEPMSEKATSFTEIRRVDSDKMTPLLDLNVENRKHSSTFTCHGSP